MVSKRAKQMARSRWVRILEHTREIAEGYDIPFSDAIQIRMESSVRAITRSRKGSRVYQYPNPTLHLPVKKETWELLQRIKVI